MKTRLLLVLALAPLALAAEPADYHAELRALKTTYETALATGDLSPLEPLFDAGSSGVTVDNQSFTTFAELKAIYDRFHAKFPGVVYQVSLDAEPSLLEGNLAIAHGTAREHVKTADGEFAYPSNWTVVLRRTDAGWKLVRSQVTMDPFNNPVVAFVSRRVVLRAALASAAGGLVLGLVIGATLRSRRRAAS